VSKMRSILMIVSALAILHLLALGGFVGYSWHNGTLNTERVELIAAVLRGEHDSSVEDETGLGEGDTEEAGSAQAAIAKEQIEEEVARRQLEREKAELEQRLELVNREMQRVRREREYFEDQRRREAEAAKKRSEQSYRDGSEKQLEYLGKIKPKDAVGYILSRDIEEAAEILRAMDTRKGKKIIEAAKTPSQRKKMDEILKLMPELKMESGPAPEGG